jgi:glycosyltransferase involved in cell wall biosynthesis
VRICLVYDCLFPHTVGGAERWYRNLAERLAAAGHDVTYLTLRQWDRREAPTVAGVKVRTVGPQMALYAAPGRRRMLPPIVFGAGVLWHLLRHGRDYDVVHTGSFPYFSVLATSVARLVYRYRVVVDWHEVWTKEYWREYLGRAAGRIGWIIQCMCAGVPQQAFCFSDLHARRLESIGLRGPVTVLRGEYAGPSARRDPLPANPVVLFAGRHINEKRVEALVPAVMLARRQIPTLTGIAFGDGPAHPHVLEVIRENQADGIVLAPGFVSSEELAGELASALCMLLPSRREGYGLIVVEAAAMGVPSIVVRGADNAATELIAEGENGTIAQSAEPDELAAAIVRIYEGAAGMRAATLAWYQRNAASLSLSGSLDQVVGTYGGARG